MANAGFDNDPTIDDPLAELERLVNARTRRMAAPEPSASFAEFEPFDRVDVGASATPKHDLTERLEFSAELEELTSALNAVEIDEPIEEQPSPDVAPFDTMLPSLAALRGGLTEPQKQEPSIEFDEFESELGTAIADAMLAGDTAMAALNAQPIESELPPATHPIDVPELPDLSNQAVETELADGIEQELMDELYFIDEEPETGTSSPIAVDAVALNDAANDNSGGRRRGWLVAAMLGGVAVIGGATAVTLSVETEPTEIAVIAASDEPHKVRPEPTEIASAPERPNPVYERVSKGASAKASSIPETRIVTSAEDVSDVRIATVAAKADDRLAPAATAIDLAVETGPAVPGPRAVRTLKVGPDGKLVRNDAMPRSSAEEVPVEIASVDPVEPLIEPRQEIAPVVAAVEIEEGTPAPGIPLPRYRPAGLVEAALTPGSLASPPTDNPIGVAPSAPLGSSEWHVQIASVPTDEGAKAVYADMNNRYASILRGRGVDYQVATIEGRGTFHRVRIEAAGKNDANSLCERLKQAGGSCFVTR